MVRILLILLLGFCCVSVLMCHRGVDWTQFTVGCTRPSAVICSIKIFYEICSACKNCGTVFQQVLAAHSSRLKRWVRAPSVIKELTSLERSTLGLFVNAWTDCECWHPTSRMLQLLQTVSSAVDTFHASVSGSPRGKQTFLYFYYPPSWRIWRAIVECGCALCCMFKIPDFLLKTLSVDPDELAVNVLSSPSQIDCVSAFSC